MPNSVAKRVSLDSFIQKAQVRRSELCSNLQTCDVDVKLKTGRYQYHGRLPQNIILQRVPGSVLALTGDLGLSSQSQWYDLTITSDNSVRNSDDAQ